MTRAAKEIGLFDAKRVSAAVSSLMRYPPSWSAASAASWA